MADGIIFSIVVATIITVITFVKTEFKKPLVKSGLSLGLSLLIYFCTLAIGTRIVEEATGEHSVVGSIYLVLLFVEIVPMAFLCADSSLRWLGVAFASFWFFDLVYMVIASGVITSGPTEIITLHPAADIPFLVAIPCVPLLLARYREVQRKARIRASELEAEKAEIIAMIEDAVNHGDQPGAASRLVEAIEKTGRKNKKEENRWK